MGGVAARGARLGQDGAGDAGGRGAAFEARAELAREAPESRVIMLSGYVRSDYIDRAVEAGAWGYVSKNEDTQTILSAIHQVAAGGFAMGSEVEAELKRRRVQ